MRWGIFCSDFAKTKLLEDTNKAKRETNISLDASAKLGLMI